jgi:hypothetical protein
MLPCIFDFCSFCHNPNRQTVSNALLKSTKEQNSFFPKENYIAIRECKTKILSTVENPLLNPACAPEEHSATSELSSMISVLVFSEYLDLLLGPGPNNAHFYTPGFPRGSIVL